MRVRLAFQQAAEGERFLVLCEELYGDGHQGVVTLSTFEGEGDFLQQVIFAELPREDATTIIAGVLTALARSTTAERWIPLTVTRKQLRRLGLAVASRPDPLLGTPEGFCDAMMQTPTPFVLLSGPDHRFRFVNHAYAELMRRSSPAAVLGKSVREALPELEGQPFFGQLDNVYRTGIPYVGRATPGMLRNEHTGRSEEHFFDFVYYPVRDADDQVCGIMVQATDVTSIRLEQRVGRSREQQLYKQWAELETIYRYSPMAMCLVDVKTFCLMRLNDLTAELFDGERGDLLGRVVFDLLPEVPGLRSLYGRVARGEVVRNHELSIELPRHSGVIRTWLLTLSPLFDESGNVELIESIGVEITDRKRLATTEPYELSLSSEG